MYDRSLGLGRFEKKKISAVQTFVQNDLHLCFYWTRKCYTEEGLPF